MKASETSDTVVGNAWNWIDLRGSSSDESDEAHMSADAEMLDKVGAGRQPATIRCYTWREPFVTYGRLQNESAVRNAYPRYRLSRRPTGGRAVLHGSDLTIAVCATHDFISSWGGANDETKRVHATYMKLVTPVKEALSVFGVEAVMGAENSCGVGGIAENGEDCFAYSAKCDLIEVDTAKKLLGSAMRRTSNAVLLQMSLQPLTSLEVRGDLFVTELRDRYQTR